MSPWIIIGALNGLLAVALGAFGAHGLAGRVGEKELAAFNTAASYHMSHALALIAVAWVASQNPSATANAAGGAFLTGILLFSGSLYFLGATGSRALVLITPIGGLAFLAGWLLLALAGWQAMKAAV